jgi:hypothetical protein
MLLHKVSIERQCSMVPEFSGRQIRQHAQRVVDDFLQAFGAGSG